MIARIARVERITYREAGWRVMSNGITVVIKEHQHR